MFNKTLDLATSMQGGMLWLALLAALVLSLGWGYGDAAQAQSTTIGGSGITAVSAGQDHTCLLKFGGVHCWGANFSGQLGSGSNNESYVPVNVSGLKSGVRAISAGGLHTCALSTGGGVQCWGSNFFGQLGIGSNGPNTNSNKPVNVSGLGSGVSVISGGNLHTCAVTTEDRVQCWGVNTYGGLGDGSTNLRNTPVNVSNVAGLSSKRVAVSAGWRHTCALTTTGGVQCWGFNSSGGLGNGSNNESHVPVEVSGLSSGVSAVSAGWTHACALMTAGGLQCWGTNRSGQLGDGSNTNSNVPVPVR